MKISKMWGKIRMDRRKNMCHFIVPVYCGNRPAMTRGKPNESKDYYFLCYSSATNEDCGYRKSRTIEELCSGCKKYYHIKPLSQDEIRERFYNGERRNVMVVSRNGWHYKEI